MTSIVNAIGNQVGRWVNGARRLGWVVVGVCLSAAVQAAGWMDTQGQWTPLALQAMQGLDRAPEQGLPASDYAAPGGRSWHEVAQAVLSADPQARVSLQSALDGAVARYLHAVRWGRLEPAERGVVYRWLWPADVATDAVLQHLQAVGDWSAVLAQTQPPHPDYEPVRQVLQRYRAWVGHPAWAQPLPPLPRPRAGHPGKLEPGQPYAGLPLLGQRLLLWGDLLRVPEASVRYEGDWVAAVQRFQQRHGLPPDGVVGAATLKQLEVTPAQRVEQLELALERLRWLPLLPAADRVLVVHIPAFELSALQRQGPQWHEAWRMKVVVGQAGKTPTPLFDADMRSIEFQPYWNVPPSIAKAETVPRLQRDPAYFTQQGFEFVTPQGQVVTALNPEHLQAVLKGSWRLRQRPGPANALGPVKFVFPNPHHIYLHHTPATQLFGRARRDFSHGCIRVEAPQQLAAWVLEGAPNWSPERVSDALRNPQPQTVRLPQPVPVVLFDGTVGIKDGLVYFYDDLYGHDRRLAGAWRSSASTRSSIHTPDRP